MSINDDDIDLTSGGKFHEFTWERDKHTSRAADKISTGKYRTLIHTKFIAEFLDKMDSIPWKKKMMECSSVRANWLKRKDDYISNEANCIIRSTSSNTIMQLGGTDDFFRQPEIMEEFFMEVLGYIPFTSIQRCWRCGQYYLGHEKDLSWLCPKCEYSDEVPWKRTDRIFA